MAPNSSTLAWKIPWMEEPGGLQSMGSQRVGHDWVTSLSLFTFMHWRRKWQPTLVFLIPGTGEPGELLSMGSHRVGHNWSDLPAAAAAAEHWVEFPGLHSRFPLVIYFIHSINSVYMSIPVSQFLPQHPAPSSWYSYICSLPLCLYFWFTNMIIYTVFLDSMYMC